jgi:hypothetical protein
MLPAQRTAQPSSKRRTKAAEHGTDNLTKEDMFTSLSRRYWDSKGKDGPAITRGRLRDAQPANHKFTRGWDRGTGFSLPSFVEGMSALCAKGREGKREERGWR